jgi:hypothetical protein
VNRGNLKSHEICILHLGYSDDKSARYFYDTKLDFTLDWPGVEILFTICSHKSLKINHPFHIGSFWTTELPLRLFYHKKASLLFTGAFLILPDILFTAALVTGLFELE